MNKQEMKVIVWFKKKEEARWIRKEHYCQAKNSMDSIGKEGYFPPTSILTKEQKRREEEKRRRKNAERWEG